MATSRRVGGDARVLALAVVVALHVGLIAWLARPAPLERAAAPPALLVEQIAAPPAPPLVAPPPPRDPVRPAEVAPPVIEIAVAPAVGTTGCDPVAVLGAALAADPAVQAGLARVPPTARTPAGAVFAWSGGWSALAGADGPLAATRGAVERALTPLGPGCLDLPVLGPRLIAVDAADGTVLLVFGSGVWSWSDAIAPQVEKMSRAAQPAA